VQHAAHSTAQRIQRTSAYEMLPGALLTSASMAGCLLAGSLTAACLVACCLVSGCSVDLRPAGQAEVGRMTVDCWQAPGAVGGASMLTI
jgi:hypothetical protein